MTGSLSAQLHWISTVGKNPFSVNGCPMIGTSRRNGTTGFPPPLLLLL